MIKWFAIKSKTTEALENGFREYHKEYYQNEPYICWWMLGEDIISTTDEATAIRIWKIWHKEGYTILSIKEID